ncbi:hypothetical protein [Phenylobacterium sp.]|uniref:hypothetical protein n=1 Tax=Phenylobacterium sp. TaxID=1871053 RepID=UPI0025FA254C|nr:hypothetical protein [Phenylobacterium sp.]
MSAVWGFLRYRWPAIPRPLADAGLSMGFAAMTLSFIPGVRWSVISLAVVGVGCLVGAASLHLHGKPQEPEGKSATAHARSSSVTPSPARADAPIPDRVTPFSRRSNAEVSNRLREVANGLRKFESDHHAEAKKLAGTPGAKPEEIRAQLANLDHDDTMRFRDLYLYDARDLVDEASKRLRRPLPADQSPNPLSAHGAQAFSAGQMYGSGLSDLAAYLDALAADLRK